MVDATLFPIDTVIDGMSSILLGNWCQKCELATPVALNGHPALEGHLFGGLMILTSGIEDSED